MTDELPAGRREWIVFLGLVVGSLVTCLAVVTVVGAAVYAAQSEAARCSAGQCDCELP